MTPDVPFVGEGSLPASGISWDDSEDFIKRLNERNETIAEGLTFRLPTVKEWRYVCLAGGPPFSLSILAESSQRSFTAVSDPSEWMQPARR